MIIERFDSSPTSSGFSDSDFGVVYITATDITSGDFILLDDWLMRNANRIAARWILRAGMFLRFDPPWNIRLSASTFWRRLMRCDRHGLGLRIRKER